MHISLKLFIVGVIVGLIVALAPYPEDVQYVDEPEKYLKEVFAGGAKIWKTVYFLILIIMLPFMAIEPLKKRLSMKQFLPFPFIAGNSVSFGVLTLISTLSTLI